MSRLAFAALAALLAMPAIANAPPPDMAEPTEWDADTVGEDWTLSFGEDIAIACPEAKKQLRVTIAPAWEVGYGKPDGTTFEGPIDKVTVKIGDKSFTAVQDAKVTDSVVYVLPADADSVTAIMLADNIEVILAADPQQTRAGEPSTDGTLDVFATTCAQINGLR